MRIAGCLIVKDAEHTLRRCLGSLDGVVDEIVVYDTGSSDATVDLARSLGAIVLEGYWDDDFARARNAALAAVTSDWVLSIDADEWLEADLDRLPQLRASLNSGPAVLGVQRFDLTADGSGWCRFNTPRLFRRHGAAWSGRVHESVEVDGTTIPGRCDPGVLRLAHDGYVDEAEARAKARRNAAIGAAEIEQLRSDPTTSAPRLARALLDLGRSLASVKEQASAVTAFEQARALVPGSPTAVRAGDHLARALLVSGDFVRVGELAAELRAAGTDPRYCDWLLAQALAQSGEPKRAVELLAGIDELTDPSGHTYDLGAVVEFRALARALSDDLDGALRDLLVAMVGHGRISGRGNLARQWWGPRPVDGLIIAVRHSGGPFAADTEHELRAAG
ncbi:MAG TPA: glycosyltransferase family 2 protein [Jatrophihabitantaceae bacterium]